MLVGCGYNFLCDIDCLNPNPVPAADFSDVKLQGGIFNHWNMTKDVTSPYSPNIPTTWDILYIMDANFNGNLNAGNIGYDFDEIDGFKVKRRKTTDFDWLTIGFIPSVADDKFDLTWVDNLAQSGVEYEYAFVPVVNGIEGSYVSDTINAEFDGVFICDSESIYKFYAGVQYGTSNRVQKVGVFEPFGRKYPVVVSNALLNYEQGSFSGTILPNDFYKNGTLDRAEMVKERKAVLDFLTNKRAKILKDWNSNYLLICVIDTPTVEYANNYGMGIATVGASYVETGDPNKQADLYNNGLTTEVV